MKTTKLRVFKLILAQVPNILDCSRKLSPIESRLATSRLRERRRLEGRSRSEQKRVYIESFFYNITGSFVILQRFLMHAF